MALGNYEASTNSTEIIKAMKCQPKKVNSLNPGNVPSRSKNNSNSNYRPNNNNLCPNQPVP